ncbi:MAG: PQQ-dependent sugar dehydrogenase [Parcubacteria group bacterium]|nr:PQQ-dependent sugar dehydrogenase [Parcubacteria group bacterium]
MKIFDIEKRAVVLLIAISIIVMGGIFYFYFSGINIVRLFYVPQLTNIQSTPRPPAVKKEIISNSSGENVKVIAENLTIPWEIVFLPSLDGEIDMLVTERPGRLIHIDKERKIIEVSGVYHAGEGGLMGLAINPDFKNNRQIYLYMTARTGEGTKNRVERFRFENDQLSERKIIIENIPGSSFHDGGRIAFGPDGYLYIATGDAGASSLSQNINSLAGKILRLKNDGGIPPDNPFGNAVYSYGHRNPQGITWDNQGRLWSTEHGRSGVLSGLDELNLIEKGKNYGWPVIQGDEEKAKMEKPVFHSGSDYTWAPTDAVYWNNSIFFGGLKGESLYEAKISDGGRINIYFFQEFGRIRVVNIGPDGNFYIATSNTDGRGDPRVGDDKIIRVNPSVFR